MRTLKLKKRKATVCLPVEIKETHYTGALFGIYIPESNFYNIIACESSLDSVYLAKQIGFIFPDKQLMLNAECEGLCGYWENEDLSFGTGQEKYNKEYYALKIDIFSRNTGILESDIMLEKKAVFIGCGSVGSLFALELARAGVGHFMLIDNDIFGYHNICRHQCGVLDVGKFKTNALKERILQINPQAEVLTYNCIIQDVPLAAFECFCNTETIMIGGADNREGDLYADHIAQDIGMPMISVGCWERAFAGEIFYCIPNEMPAYSDFMAALGDTSGRVNQNRKFYTNEEDLEKAVFEPGISVDINFVTIIAVKLAIDLLNRNNKEYIPRVISHLSQYTLVCNTNDSGIGGDMAEIFSYPLQVTTSIIVPYANEVK